MAKECCLPSPCPAPEVLYYTTNQSGPVRLPACCNPTPVSISVVVAFFFFFSLSLPFLRRMLPLSNPPGRLQKRQRACTCQTVQNPCLCGPWLCSKHHAQGRRAHGGFVRPVRFSFSCRLRLHRREAYGIANYWAGNNSLTICTGRRPPGDHHQQVRPTRPLKTRPPKRGRGTGGQSAPGTALEKRSIAFVLACCFGEDEEEESSLVYRDLSVLDD